jgi:hypothetical protein
MKTIFVYIRLQLESEKISQIWEYYIRISLYHFIHSL